MNRRPIINVLAMSLILAPSACEEANLKLPSESEAGVHYANSSDLTVRVSGNVVEVIVQVEIVEVMNGDAEPFLRQEPVVAVFAGLQVDEPGREGEQGGPFVDSGIV